MTEKHEYVLVEQSPDSWREYRVVSEINDSWLLECPSRLDRCWEMKGNGCHLSRYETAEGAFDAAKRLNKKIAAAREREREIHADIFEEFGG